MAIPGEKNTASARLSLEHRYVVALRQRSIGDLMNTFTDLGKKEPLALFGGAVLAGFAISRFLKSSADTSR